MHRSRFTLIFFLIIFQSIAQVGTWKSYTDMKNIRDIVFVKNKLWAATSGGVFRYNINAGQSSFDRFTNVDGLSNIDVTAITADPDQRIYVGSSTGYINMFDPSNNSWSVIPDIARATSRPQRGINKFVLASDKMYIATDFGVVVYVRSKNEFGDTYVKFGNLASPLKVNDIFIDNNTIWIASDKGIGRASLLSQNLQEPSNWISYSMTNGLPSTNILSIISFQNQIVAGSDAGAAYFNGSKWIPISLPQQNASVVQLSTRAADELYITTPTTIYRLTSFTNIETFLKQENFISPAAISFTSLLVESGEPIIAGTTYGVSIIDNYLPDKKYDLLRPNGPNSNQFVGMSIDDAGLLWCASGAGVAGKGFYSFDGTTWMNYTAASHPVIASDTYVRTNRGADGSRWFNAWGDGLLLMRSNGIFTRYSAQNVPGFPGVGTSPNYNVTDGTAVDSKGTTWSVHYRGMDGKILSAFTKDSTWTFFSCGAVPGAEELNKIVIDIYGTKWMMINDALFTGIVTFNDHGTLKDLTDDKWDKINGKDPAGINAETNVTDITIDLNGDIWIGTDIGLRTVFNPNNPQKITTTCNNTRCNIEGQRINSIAIDALNNKWLGTRSGVFVLSPDGSTIMAQYNTLNSPLLDDDVKSVVVHPTTGVAYFGTDKGLSSLQTTSVKPAVNNKKLHIFPNPFRPEQDESVSIDGLMDSATLKILAADGSVIADVITPGGRIGFWDGRTNSGKYAPAGMYIIAAYNPDGTTVSLGKIAVIR